MSYTKGTLIGRNGYSDMGDTGDNIVNILKDVAKGALDVYGSGREAAGRAGAAEDLAAKQAEELRKGGGMPSWAIPAMVGVGGIAILLLMKGRK